MSVARARVHASIGCMWCRQLLLARSTCLARASSMPTRCRRRRRRRRITCAWKLYACAVSKVDRSGAAAEKRDRYIGAADAVSRVMTSHRVHCRLRPDKDLLVGWRRRHQSVAEANSRVCVLNWGRRRAGSRMTKHRENARRRACAISRYPWSPFPPRYVIPPC